MNARKKITLTASALFMTFGTAGAVAAKDVEGKRGNNNKCIIAAPEGMNADVGGFPCSDSNVSCPNNGLGQACTVTLNGTSYSGRTTLMELRKGASDFRK